MRIISLAASNLAFGNTTTVFLLFRRAISRSSVLSRPVFRSLERLANINRKLEIYPIWVLSYSRSQNGFSSSPLLLLRRLHFPFDTSALLRAKPSRSLLPTLLPPTYISIEYSFFGSLVSPYHKSISTAAEGDMNLTIQCLPLQGLRQSSALQPGRPDLGARDGRRLPLPLVRRDDPGRCGRGLRVLSAAGVFQRDEPAEAGLHGRPHTSTGLRSRFAAR